LKRIYLKYDVVYRLVCSWQRIHVFTLLNWVCGSCDMKHTLCHIQLCC